MTGCFSFCCFGFSSFFSGLWTGFSSSFALNSFFFSNSFLFASFSASFSFLNFSSSFFLSSSLFSFSLIYSFSFSTTDSSTTVKLSISPSKPRAFKPSFISSIGISISWARSHILIPFFSSLCSSSTRTEDSPSTSLRRETTSSSIFVDGDLIDSPVRFAISCASCFHVIPNSLARSDILTFDKLNYLL